MLGALFLSAVVARSWDLIAIRSLLKVVRWSFTIVQDDGKEATYATSQGVLPQTTQADEDPSAKSGNLAGGKKVGGLDARVRRAPSRIVACLGMCLHAHPPSLGATSGAEVETDPRSSPSHPFLTIACSSQRDFDEQRSFRSLLSPST